jgi:hypothetical protein
MAAERSEEGVVEDMRHFPERNLIRYNEYTLFVRRCQAFFLAVLSEVS